MNTSESQRVGRAFTRSVGLHPGERVLKTSNVSRERLFLSIFGSLYLTDQRLIFCPYLYTLSWSPVVLDIAEIDSCGEASIPWYRNLAHLVLSMAWYVQTGKHRHFFVSLGEDDKEAWLRAISSVADVPIGEPRAF